VLEMLKRFVYFVYMRAKSSLYISRIVRHALLFDYLICQVVAYAITDFRGSATTPTRPGNGPGGSLSPRRGVFGFMGFTQALQRTCITQPTPEALRQPYPFTNVAVFVGGGGNLGYIRPIVRNSSLITFKVPNR